MAGNLNGVFLSEKEDWLTPKHIVASIIEVMNGIDVDPCADSGKHIPAKRHYTKTDDGLSREWRGKVFMNPPYGRSTPRWATRWRQEYEAGHFKKGIALVAARTDTKWWRDIVSTAAVVCFIDGRLHFGNNEGAEITPSTFPSAALYACRDDVGEIERFARVFSEHGNVWVKYGV